MTPDQLPASAQVDVGLFAFAFLVTMLLAALASIVVAWRHERRKADRLTPAQLDRTLHIAETRDTAGPPWPWHDHTWDELYPVDAEGEAGAVTAHQAFTWASVALIVLVGAVVLMPAASGDVTTPDHCIRPAPEVAP